MANDMGSSQAIPAVASALGADSARQFGWRLAVLYLQGTAVAVTTTMLLAAFGLEMNAYQWVLVLSMTPPALAFFVSPEIWLIARHYQPLRRALARFDAGETPTVTEARTALVRSLNLPFYGFLRITFIHGPMAALAGSAAMLAGNRWFDGGFQTWQMLIFSSLILFFASPGHAIVEFFSLSKRLVPIIRRLWPHCEGSWEGIADRPIAVGLQSKLLYLCVFITALPLLFVAFSIVFKIDLLMDRLGVNASVELLGPLWLWILSVMLVCLCGAVAMSVLTAREVTRAATRLIGGMNEVEKGNLGADLEITGTDEYADLYRGFNLMVEGLRDEVRMLEVSQDLSGELHLDVLIARILAAATELLDADRSTLFVHDPAKRELWSRYADGPATREIRIRDDAGIAGHVFQTGRVEHIAEPYADPRFNPQIDVATGYRTRSILCMPISNKAGTRIGVTQVLNKKNGPFTAKDAQRLRAFSAQIAVTLDNARLFDEVLAIKNYNENVLASTTNGVITLDTQGRIVTVNAAAQRILAREAASLVEQPAARVFADDANAWVMVVVDKALGLGLSANAVDASLLRADGSSASVNLTANPLLNAEAVTIGAVLSFEDFTREKRVKSTMSRYMSPQVAERLLEAGDEVLGGQVQTVSILFSDVRGFTSLSEQLGPRETVSLLNEYFAQMVEVVFRREGILDKYIGDAIMALYGSPFTGPQDADNAVASACDMICALRGLNLQRLAQGHGAIDIGIGIATGDVVVGSIGSPRRMEYTVIGDAVNLASRLESATKQYGVRVLLAESTVKALKTPVPVREIDRLRVKGKDHAVTVYEAIGHHDEQSFPHLDACMAIYGAGMDAYRAREWSHAMEAFEQVLALNGEDRPSQIHLERCAHYLDHPPAGHWDGVWTLRDK